MHVANSAVFHFDGLQLVNQPYIRHGSLRYLSDSYIQGTINILRIPRGKVALVNDNNRPRLLEGKLSRWKAYI